MARRPKTRTQQRTNPSPGAFKLNSSNSSSNLENQSKLANEKPTLSANGKGKKASEGATPKLSKIQNGNPKTFLDSSADVSLLVDSDDAAPSSSKKQKKKIVDLVSSDAEVKSKNGRKSVVVNDSPDIINRDETAGSSASAKKKRRNKKAKNSATPNNSNYNIENAGSTPLSTFTTSNAGNTPRLNGRVFKNESIKKLSFGNENEDSSFADLDNADKTPDNTKRKRRRNKKRTSTVADTGDDTASGKNKSTDKSLINRSAVVKTEKKTVSNGSEEVGQVAPKSRKRKAAQRAQEKLALVPVNQRKDDTDPEDASYVVESPDEDGQPKRARIEESGDSSSTEELNFNADIIRASLDALLNRGNCFRDSSESLNSSENLNSSHGSNKNHPDPGYEDSDDVEFLSDSDDSDGLFNNEAQAENNSGDSEDVSSFSDDGDDAVYDLNDIGLYSANDEDISSDDDELNNSDDDIDNAIATIRPRNTRDNSTEILLDHLYEQGIGHTSDESSGSETGEVDVIGPVDDLAEHEEADDADLHEDNDSGDDLDGFVVDEDDLEFFTDSDDDENEENSLDDIDEDIEIDSENDTVDSNEVSDCYKVGEKFKFDVEGYQISKDRGLLVSVVRTSAPKIKDGPMKVFSFNTELDENSVTVAKNAFNWVIAPAHMETFYANIFQRRVFHISRRDKKFYDGLFSSDTLLRIIQENDLKYGSNINVAFFTTTGGRETHNLEGRVFAHQIKSFVEAGMSIQFINPQSYCDTIWYLCEILQEMTNNFVGANTYLTPVDSAGFAPHWDDVDAFVLQIEGSKRWRVWAPLDGDEALPDDSSRNFTEQEMKSRDIVFDGTLFAGDMLYIPRGFYHAAATLTEEHSLHVTISFCHKVTFTHLLKGITDEVWHSVRQNRLLARRSVPPHFLEMNGVANLDYDSKYDEEMLPVINTVLEDLVDTYREAIPSAVDNLALEFYKQALPPMLSPEEAKTTIHGEPGLKMFEDSSLTISRMKEIRFIRMHAQRLLYQTEEDPFIVHRMGNSRILSENTEPQTIKIETKMIDGVLTLFKEYPGWIKVKDLGCGKHVNIELAKILFQAGLIMVRDAK